MKPGFRTSVLACVFAALAFALVGVVTSPSASAGEAAVNNIGTQSEAPHVAADARQGRMIPDRAPAAASGSAAEATATQAGVESGAEARKRKVRRATFTFYNSNATGTQINFRFFSETRRNWVWPAGNRHWISPPNRKRYHVKLSCLKGEKVCFGGWAPNRPGYYWGVGQNGTKACSSCCYICNNNYASVRFVW